MSEWADYLRKVAGHMSQLQLAQLSGVDPTQVSRWFRSKSVPSTPNVLKVVRALDLDESEALAAAAAGLPAGEGTSRATPKITLATPRTAGVSAADSRPVPDDPIRVGATIRALRVARGMSVEELANLAGTTVPYLSNIEAGRRGVTPALAEELAVRLDVPLDALVRSVVDREVTQESAPPGDTTIIDFGSVGTVTVSLDVRLLNMSFNQVQELLGVVDELRQLGARYAAEERRQSSDE